MMVMTAKVNYKKMIALIAVLVVVVFGLITLLGGADEAQTTAAEAVADNDARVKFLENFGWDVAASAVESGKVRIPAEASEVFDRYAALQKSQGFDLAPYAGKTVMRYVYEVRNYPGATEPVYATLLISKGQVIGGDITNTAADGKVQDFAMPTQSG